MNHCASIQRTAACALVLVALGVVGCATPQPTAVAVSELQPTQGNSVSGHLRFEQWGAKMHVKGEVRGLAPNSEHGFHVHAKGDCSSGDGTSAAGHFNPGNAAHGHFGRGPHHLGDIPSLKADAQGVARVDFETTDLTVLAGDNSVVGRGLIVHRDADDYTSQPAGNAGPRQACGVVMTK